MKTSTKKKSGLKRMLGIAALCLAVNVSLTAQCNASYTYTATNSSISLTSTSTGTTSTTVYNWSMAGLSGSGISPVFSSLYNGTYVLTLNLSSGDSSNTCSSSSSQTITISGGQNAPACSASYTYATGSAGLATFTNTSPVDSYSNTSYAWYFGDSYNSSSNSTNSSFTYYYNGTYNVTLIVYNPVTNCTNSTTQTVTITNANPLPACNSNFTYTLGATGLANFTSLYTGATSGINYTWDFGDGVGYSISQNPSYTYPYNGTYNVTLHIQDSVANCSSSTTQTVSITNTATPPCNPTASFYMYNPDSLSVGGTWNIVPHYSSQVTSANWHWGDGTSTTGLYPAHTFSVAGHYNICVTVYAACGDSSTTCQNDSIYRLAHNNSTNSIIQVNVIDTISSVGIKTNVHEAAQISVYPNPSVGLFTLQLSNVSASASKAQISISNILGEVIYTSQEQITNNALAKNIDLENIPNGAYFMKVIVGDKTFTHKTIISK